MREGSHSGPEVAAASGGTPGGGCTGAHWLAPQLEPSNSEPRDRATVSSEKTGEASIAGVLPAEPVTGRCPGFSRPGSVMLCSKVTHHG